MADAIGPRMYLVGQILSALLSGSDSRKASQTYNDQSVVEAVRLADLALNAMSHSDGQPH